MIKDKYHGKVVIWSESVSRNDEKPSIIMLVYGAGFTCSLFLFVRHRRVLMGVSK